MPLTKKLTAKQKAAKLKRQETFRAKKRQTRVKSAKLVGTEQEHIERFIKEHGVTVCPPFNSDGLIHATVMPRLKSRVDSW